MISLVYRLYFASFYVALSTPSTNRSSSSDCDVISQTQSTFVNVQYFSYCFQLVLEFNESEIAKATAEKKILGKGGYGVVYQGYMRSTQVAIKFLNEV